MGPRFPGRSIHGGAQRLVSRLSDRRSSPFATCPRVVAQFHCCAAAVVRRDSRPFAFSAPLGQEFMPMVFELANTNSLDYLPAFNDDLFWA
jgi:hypothetical protein